MKTHVSLYYYSLFLLAVVTHQFTAAEDWAKWQDEEFKHQQRDLQQVTYETCDAVQVVNSTYADTTFGLLYPFYGKLFSVRTKEEALTILTMEFAVKPPSGTPTSDTTDVLVGVSMKSGTFYDLQYVPTDWTLIAMATVPVDITTPFPKLLIPESTFTPLFVEPDSVVSFHVSLYPGFTEPPADGGVQLKSQMISTDEAAPDDYGRIVLLEDMNMDVSVVYGNTGLSLSDQSNIDETTTVADMDLQGTIFYCGGILKNSTNVTANEEAVDSAASSETTAATATNETDTMGDDHNETATDDTVFTDTIDLDGNGTGNITATVEVGGHEQQVTDHGLATETFTNYKYVQTTLTYMFMIFAEPTPEMDDEMCDIVDKYLTGMMNTTQMKNQTAKYQIKKLGDTTGGIFIASGKCGKDGMFSATTSCPSVDCVVAYTHSAALPSGAFEAALLSLTPNMTADMQRHMQTTKPGSKVVSVGYDLVEVPIQITLSGVPPTPMGQDQTAFMAETVQKLVDSVLKKHHNGTSPVLGFTITDQAVNTGRRLERSRRSLWDIVLGRDGTGSLRGLQDSGPSSVTVSGTMQGKQANNDNPSGFAEDVKSVTPGFESPVFINQLKNPGLGFRPNNSTRPNDGYFDQVEGVKFVVQDPGVTADGTASPDSLATEPPAANGTPAEESKRNLLWLWILLGVLALLLLICCCCICCKRRRDRDDTEKEPMKQPHDDDDEPAEEAPKPLPVYMDDNEEVDKKKKEKDDDEEEEVDKKKKEQDDEEEEEDKKEKEKDIIVDEEPSEDLDEDESGDMPAPLRSESEPALNSPPVVEPPENFRKSEPFRPGDRAMPGEKSSSGYRFAAPHSASQRQMPAAKPRREAPGGGLDRDTSYRMTGSMQTAVSTRGFLNKAAQANAKKDDTSGGDSP